MRKRLVIWRKRLLALQASAARLWEIEAYQRVWPSVMGQLIAGALLYFYICPTGFAIYDTDTRLWALCVVETVLGVCLVGFVARLAFRPGNVELSDISQSKTLAWNTWIITRIPIFCRPQTRICLARQSAEIYAIEIYRGHWLCLIWGMCCGVAQYVLAYGSIYLTVFFLGIDKGIHLAALCLAWSFAASVILTNTLYTLRYRLLSSSR
jgi:hypothetical protein